jgi:hypothetical protein
VSGTQQVAVPGVAGLGQPGWRPIGPLEQRPDHGGGYDDAGAISTGQPFGGSAGTGAQDLGGGAQDIGAQRRNSCPNVLSNEPVVMFEVSGATLVGEVHRQLTVYGNGRATLSEKIGSGFSRVATTMTSVEDVNDLRLRLAANGAFMACDQEFLVLDVPLRTLTVFDGETDARAHTVSYWINSDMYAGLDEALEQFITGHFNEE